MAYQTVKSVTKALKILELLIGRSADNRVLTLAEVEKATGILPATARNLLRTLEECGYVHRRAHGQYEEGERCYNLLRSGGIIRKLREISTPIIERTCRDLSESLLLVSIVNGNRLELIRSQTEDDRMERPSWQANADLYRMRTTRAILAWFSSEQLSFFVERNGLPAADEWPECANTLEGLKNELKVIRRQGGCNDRQGGFAALAVPILTGANEVVASLGCYAPLERTDMARATGIFKMIQDCAGLIRDQLS
jgi:DNA-binding IclR family transcriptional regulator